MKGLGKEMNRQCTPKKLSIRKGDTVLIIGGREKGKTGKVLSVLRNSNRIVVEKLNLVKRHSRPSQKSPQGGISEKESPMSYSNVLLFCPKCDDGVRIGHKMSGKNKLRICKKCGESI